MKYQDNLPKLKLCNLKTHIIFLPKNEFFKLHNHRGDSKNSDRFDSLISLSPL